MVPFFEIGISTAEMLRHCTYRGARLLCAYILNVIPLGEISLAVRNINVAGTPYTPTIEI